MADLLNVSAYLDRVASQHGVCGQGKKTIPRLRGLGIEQRNDSPKTLLLQQALFIRYPQCAVIDEVVSRFKDGSITQYVYDTTVARLIAR